MRLLSRSDARSLVAAAMRGAQPGARSPAHVPSVARWCFHIRSVAKHTGLHTVIAFHLALVLFGSSRAAAQRQPPDGVPSVIHECEGSLCSDWTWSNGQFVARWPNRAIATLTVESFTASSVRIIRTDTSNSSTAGLTAVYTAQISAQGNRIVNG